MNKFLIEGILTYGKIQETFTKEGEKMRSYRCSLCITKDYAKKLNTLIKEIQKEKPKLQSALKENPYEALTSVLPKEYTHCISVSGKLDFLEFFDNKHQKITSEQINDGDLVIVRGIFKISSYENKQRITAYINKIGQKKAKYITLFEKDNEFFEALQRNNENEQVDEFDNCADKINEITNKQENMEDEFEILLQNGQPL